MYVGLKVKARHYCQSLMEHEFSRQIFFRKNAQTPNFNKIRPVGAERFHADGRTDMVKLKDAFRSLTNAPKYKYSVTDPGDLKSRNTRTTAARHAI